MNVDAAERAVRDLIAALGEDPDRPGVVGTPRRAAKAWAEMVAGYDMDAPDVLRTSEDKAGFDAQDYDEMIVVAGIPFWSVCEHHLLPFGGEADVGYIPGASGTIVGLSKVPRLVEVFARRLQVQERLTTQVASALEAHLTPSGVGVRVTARHLCASCRGVRKDVRMVTSALRGVFHEHAVRDEFWSLADRGGR